VLRSYLPSTVFSNTCAALPPFEVVGVRAVLNEGIRKVFPSSNGSKMLPDLLLSGCGWRIALFSFHADNFFFFPSLPRLIRHIILSVGDRGFLPPTAFPRFPFVRLPLFLKARTTPFFGCLVPRVWALQSLNIFLLPFYVAIIDNPCRLSSSRSSGATFPSVNLSRSFSSLRFPSRLPF